MELSSVDKENMLAILADFPNQIKKAYSLRKDFVIPKPDHIFVCGMGGSGIGGMLLKSYLATIKKTPPVFVVNDYILPDYATKNSLVFVVSYSGNTEETLSCYKSALSKSCQIVVITTGGKLATLCNSAQKSFIKIPSGMQPRNAVGYLFIPMLGVLEANKIIQSQEVIIESMINTLSNKEIFAKAKEFAEKLVNKVPIIYCSEKIKPVAYRWKTQFNECTKIMAFSHSFPELNHNEIVGYTKLNADYFVVIIEDSADSMQIKKRMQITKQLIVEHRAPCITLKIKGTDLLTRMFNAMYLGDLTSYFLALDYHTDPTPVEIIETLKKQL